MVQEATSTILQVLKQVKSFLDVAHRYDSTNTSLVEKGSLVRVEPLCVVDNSLRTSEAISDTQSAMLNMFAGFYLQAVHAGTADQEMHISDKLEPYSIDVKPSATVWRKIANESYSQSIDKGSINPFTGEKIASYSKEDKADNVGGKNLEKAIAEIKESSNLAVGKIINVTFRDTTDGNVREITIPIGIRLMGGYLNSNSLKEILSFSISERSALERKIGFYTGKLSFFKDIIFVRDMYAKFRRNLMRDKTGFFKSTAAHQSDSVIYKMITGQSSVAGISSLVVLSADTAKQLEYSTNTSLSKAGERNNLFTTSGVMIMAVIDDDYRIVKFYYHSVDKPLEVSFSDLRKSSGKSESNISEIVSALAMGNAPRL